MTDYRYIHTNYMRGWKIFPISYSWNNEHINERIKIKFSFSKQQNMDNFLE